MKIEVKKVITLNDSDKYVLRNAIEILERLNEETAEEHDYNELIDYIEEILYHEPWEVEYEV